MKRALVVQCGGPTAVINASLAAVIEGCQGAHGEVWGARMGTQGLAEGSFVDLSALPAAQREALAVQPGSALGSGRYALDDESVAAALVHLERTGIDTLFLIGGNGTMGAAQSFAQAAPHLRVLGIPKTIDNDLVGTEVAPGYASAARYLAISVREAILDLRAMANFDQVAVVESMGRHTGWLAAAGALARAAPNDGPHLILLPEVAVDEDELLARIAAIHRDRGICCVVAAEGAHDHQGRYLAEKMGNAGQDGRGQRVFSMAAGVSFYLSQRIQSDLGLRCRQIRPNTFQRGSRALAAPIDRELARQVGAAAVALALDGASGVMVGLRRVEEAAWQTASVALAEVVGRERPLPPGMIDGAHSDVTAEFVRYAAPLLGELGPPPIVWA